jgi:arylsulfatase A
MVMDLKLLLIPLVAGVFSCTDKASVQEKPNVVIIYLDDLGYGDLGCYGTSTIATPHVDRLAENGIRFTNAYSSAATCTPSRYSLLTGEYAFRIKAGIQDGNAPLLIKEGTPTLPGMLQANGYKTALIGKWHLGLGDGNLDWNGKIVPGPLERGFDYAWMIPATGDRVPTAWVENHHVAGLDPEDPVEVSYKEKVGNDPTGLENPELLRIPADHQHAKTIVNGVSRIGWMSGGNAARWNDEQIPHLMLKKAREFIRENRDEPFFIYFSMHDVHDPRLPDYRFIGKSGLGNYGDVVVQMDWVTGQLVEYLEKVGLGENTLVIFSSDNGPALNDGYEDHRSIAHPDSGNHRSSGPLRGGKYSAFEAGTRMPTIAYWPAVIGPGVSDALISQVDLYASIAAILGHTLQPDEAPDSEDLSEVLLGRSRKGREYLVTESFTYSVRKGNFKYIHPVKNLNSSGWIGENKKIESGASLSPQLYDLSLDIGEQNNIAAENEAVVKEMQEYLEGSLGTDQDR